MTISQVFYLIWLAKVQLIISDSSAPLSHDKIEVFANSDSRFYIKLAFIIKKLISQFFINFKKFVANISIFIY